MHADDVGSNFAHFLLISAFQSISLRPYGALWRKIHSEVLKSNLFQISGITSDIASEKFTVWKVSVSRSECSNIGKLFE